MEGGGGEQLLHDQGHDRRLIGGQGHVQGSQDSLQGEGYDLAAWR